MAVISKVCNDLQPKQVTFQISGEKVGGYKCSTSFPPFSTSTWATTATQLSKMCLGILKGLRRKPRNSVHTDTENAETMVTE